MATAIMNNLQHANELKRLLLQHGYPMSSVAHNRKGKGYVVSERAIDDSQMIQLAQQVGGRLS